VASAVRGNPRIWGLPPIPGKAPGPVDDAWRVPEPLTNGERRVVELVARGLTNQEVAAALELRTKTVEWTLTNVYRKLRLRSRTELAIHMARLEADVR
jgi:DNA-binding NarL/FixJ family response regulator